MQAWFNISKSINVIQLFNKMKNKSHIIVSMDTHTKLFGKIQHPFMINTLNTLSIEGVYLYIKNIYDKPTNNIVLDYEKYKAFPLKSGVKQIAHSYHFYESQYWKF